MTQQSDHITLPNNTAENRYRIPWGKTLLGLVISLASVAYFSTQVDFSQLRGALLSAKVGPIIWSIIVILVTGVAKAWRWQWLYYPAVPKFAPTYRSIMSGQMLNLISPIPRLGDLARLYQMQTSSQIPAGTTLGTIVSEKSFDLLLTVLLAIAIIPFFAIPEIVSQQMFSLAIIGVVLLAILYLLVFQADRILLLTQTMTRPLPTRVAGFINKLADRSLQGLAVLKHGRVTVFLVLLSAGIGVLSFLTPLLIFQAFDMPYGVTEALLMNAFLSLSLTLPSAPGRIGTFESFVVAGLVLFGSQDDLINLAYGITYHAIAVIPILIIGALSLGLSDWRITQRLKESGIN